MTKIQIKNRWDETVIFETDAARVGDAVKAAVAAKINLEGANLDGANLDGANLQGAYLEGANLDGANLDGANLRGAYLRGANLQGANLQGAYLEGANLDGANLQGANLQGAYLEGANLDGANLDGANLRGAYLRGANLQGAYLAKKQLEQVLATRTILPDGDIIGWKKLLDGKICKLQIPAKADRIGGLIGRKCRAEFAVVLDGEGVSIYDVNFTYKRGETVKPDKFDANPLVECSGGIHFYITKAEAEAH